MEKETKKKSVHYGHRGRVKKRFLNEGIASFEDHEALEMLLYFSVPQGDTNELAHELINKFGSLSGVFDASVDELTRVNGVGLHTATLIKFIPEIYSKYLLSKRNAPKLTLDSGSAAGEYFLAHLMNKKEETLMAAYLDANLVVKKCVVLSEGDLSSAEVNMAKLISNAMNCSAVNIIIAHNHPSGVAAPSNTDVDVVREMARILSRTGLRLCDSIIVAGEEYLSMAEVNKYKFIF